MGVKEEVLIGLFMMRPRERRQWLSLIRPEEHVIDGKALAALIDVCTHTTAGKEVIASMSADEIADCVAFLGL